MRWWVMSAWTAGRLAMACSSRPGWWRTANRFTVIDEQGLDFSGHGCVSVIEVSVTQGNRPAKRGLAAQGFAESQVPKVFAPRDQPEDRKEVCNSLVTV